VAESNQDKTINDPTVDDLGGKDPYDDDLIKQIYTRDKSSGKAKRAKLARDWFRSELFYNGIQWITFDSKLKRWRESGLKKTTPRPVTNTYANYCDIFSSLLCSIPVEVTYRPLNSNDQIDQNKMKIANELSDAIQQVVNIKNKQRDAAPMLTRQGEVFLIPMLLDEGIGQSLLNEEADEMIEPPLEEVMEEPLNIEPGEPASLESLIQDTLTGEEKEETPSVPKLTVDVASAFECYMDESADSLDDSSFFIREKSYDLSILKTVFPDKASEISPASKISGDVSKFFAGSLSRLTSGDLGSSGYFVASEQNNTSRGNLDQYWRDPCKNYPKGIYAIIVNGDIVVHKGPLPFHDTYGKHYKNIIQIRAKKRTKNVHGRTPLDDAIPKQIQRNKLESFIELIIFRMAAPHWLLPKDCGVQNLSGDPGTSITYNRVSASQTGILKPEMVSGISPPPIVIQWLQKIDEDCEYILGITKALMGQLPPGLPAARALDMLMQRSRDRHGDVFAEWNAKWAECVNMMLKIVRQTKPVDLFNTVKRTYGGFMMKQFSESDYDLNLEIVPETEQPAPSRSTAAEMQLIEEFQTSGLFQAPPNLQYEVFSRYGFDFLVKGLKSDKEYASRENYELIKDNKVPMVKPFDNHPVHFEDHRIFYQSDEYQEWEKMNPQLAQGFVEHIQGHQQLMMQAEQVKAQNAQPQIQQSQPRQVA